MKNTLKGLLISCIFLFFIGCNKPAEKNPTLKVGTIAGPETQLMETAKKVAQDKYHLTIEIIEFTDYLTPNTALNDGSIDANVFQHQPYLDQQIKDRGYQLIAIGKTFVYPMGIYSSKIINMKDIPDNATIAIPNDPSNEGRALLLLQKTGLISLKPNIGLYATPNDIATNPKQLQFKELDAAQLPRSLADVDLAIINTNYAIPAGLTPSKALFQEDKTSPYANIIAIRINDRNDPRMQQLVKAIQSFEVLQTAKEIFHNEAIAAWPMEINK